MQKRAPVRKRFFLTPRTVGRGTIRDHRAARIITVIRVRGVQRRRNFHNWTESARDTLPRRRHVRYVTPWKIDSPPPELVEAIIRVPPFRHFPLLGNGQMRRKNVMRGRKETFIISELSPGKMEFDATAARPTFLTTRENYPYKVERVKVKRIFINF